MDVSVTTLCLNLSCSVTSKTLLVVLVCVLLPQGTPVVVSVQESQAVVWPLRLVGREAVTGNRNLFLSSVTYSSLASSGKVLQIKDQNTVPQPFSSSENLTQGNKI